MSVHFLHTYIPNLTSFTPNVYQEWGILFIETIEVPLNWYRTEFLSQELNTTFNANDDLCQYART